MSVPLVCIEPFLAPTILQENHISLDEETENISDMAKSPRKSYVEAAVFSVISAHESSDETV
jgi:hypothetical protein